MITFEWDEEKANENVRRHGIYFEDAVKIFNDPHRIVRLTMIALAMRSAGKQ